MVLRLVRRKYLLDSDRSICAMLVSVCVCARTGHRAKSARTSYTAQRGSETCMARARALTTTVRVLWLYPSVAQCAPTENGFENRFENGNMLVARVASSMCKIYDYHRNCCSDSNILVTIIIIIVKICVTRKTNKYTKTQRYILLGRRVCCVCHGRC